LQHVCRMEIRRGGGCLGDRVGKNQFVGKAKRAFAMGGERSRWRRRVRLVWGKRMILFVETKPVKIA